MFLVFCASACQLSMWLPGSWLPGPGLTSWDQSARHAGETLPLLAVGACALILSWLQCAPIVVIMS